jgi:hypothetical protein
VAIVDEEEDEYKVGANNGPMSRPAGQFLAYEWFFVVWRLLNFLNDLSSCAPEGGPLAEYLIEDVRLGWERVVFE